ncbi:tetratricopeptide repeat protein [Falsihalocynthiibacter arcticus]|uniref:Tetratricopeptide repeat-like domain-containing protein n=1 Tax=Falsihalocynthiibacter arcticus TaxID=1579316 RepID=A0A126UYU2_9RHOB|nr:tetratricopeptide repeat protein [Falsihalocynthiibacter arcticus]AML51223.1 hypothetical protein RC74_08120 [Falsihalocynthiibacter arcticus]
MKHSFLRTALLSTALFFSGFSAQSEGLSGAYLAARSASSAADFEEAVVYFTRALALDPDNTFLMNNAAASFLSLGQIDSAIPIAAALEEQDVHSQIADLVLTIEEIRNGEYDTVSKRIKDGADLGPVLTQLIDAWAELGSGKMSVALEKFDALEAQPSFEGIANFHRALALGSVGDYGAALEVFESIEEKGFSHTRSTLIAYVEILSQMERNDDALEALGKAYNLGDADPEFADLYARLENGETLAFTAAPSAREGVAQAAFTLAEILSVEGTPDQTILYSRMAEILDPSFIPAVLLTAEMLEELEQFDLATKAYAKVPTDHPSFHLAEIGRADTLRRAGKPEAAVEVLRTLSKNRPELPAVLIGLGDLLRSQEEYLGAIEAYDGALELFPEITPNLWFVFYSRGISHERSQDWEKAEADFRQALALYPDQPQVLNYLGYSMVEKNENLDEALEMIEKAVEARPEDGYIIDSLAWAYYKLGRYEEAAELMEKAAQLEPVDPVVSDHLGDALWMVNRKIEADFQWRRALSFEPEEKDADRIRRKLEVGLDEVLADEEIATED